MENSVQNNYTKSSERRIRIIHCDDHSIFRFGVKSALSKYSEIEIIGEAVNGQDLLNLLETLMPDMVVMNIVMPVLNGIETMPRIKERYPNLKVIVLSMHNARETIIKMLQLGANSYLTKNSSSEDIYRAIKCVDEYDYFYSVPMEWALLGPSLQFKRTGKKYGQKELQILELLKQQKTATEIGEILNITEKTVSAMISKLPKSEQ